MRRVVVLGLLFAAGGSAWADGMYFSPVPDPPSIPTQRAMIVWRDGVETLVVESTVKTASPDLGWVLPLPAEPRSLDVMDAGTLTCMASCQRPELLSGQPRFMPGPLWTAAGLVTLVVVLHLVLVRKWNGWRYVQMLLCCFLVGAGYWHGFGRWDGEGQWTELSAKGHAAGGGIEVSGETRIGNYTATVLRAKSSAALDEWLWGNGLLKLDPAARKIVDEYIAAKWCFVVARLRKDVSQATPQPIVARFATAGPVYPMRLTALNRATTHVDLYVVADRQAQAPGFECIAADTYAPTNERSYSITFDYRHDRWGAHYRAKKLDLKVGNPDVGELMWDGCVLTALAADMPPENMASDIAISMAPLQPARAVRCTQEYREGCDLRNAFFGGLGLVVFAGYMFWGRRNPGLGGWLVTVGAVAAAIVVTSIFHNALPPAMPTHQDRMVRDAPYEFKSFLDAKAREGKVKFPLGEKDLEALVQEAVENNRLPLGLKKERSPGNWSVRTVDGRTYICFYDRDGVELRALPEPQSDPYRR